LGLSSEKSDDIDRGALVPGAKVPNPPNPTGEGASEPADKFLANAITSSQLALATNLVNLVQGNSSNTLVIEEVEDTLINIIFQPAAFDVSTVSLDTFLVRTATITSPPPMETRLKKIYPRSLPTEGQKSCQRGLIQQGQK
jgi:hypothetical protein